jgi:Nucleotidyl transferase AbiEii toxin, Type IV TA system
MDERLSRWEVLFQRALILIDSVREIGISVDDWTFGVGTVLMRRHRHRFSKDIDIFINDPQFLGYLTPRLSPTAESLTAQYIEDHDSETAGSPSPQRLAVERRRPES